MRPLNLKTMPLSHKGSAHRAVAPENAVKIETSPAVELQSSQALLLCSYQNLSATLQIVRVMDAQDQLLLERVLWAEQALEFWAQPDARLEVFSGELTNSLMVDSIICERLQSKTASAA